MKFFFCLRGQFVAYNQECYATDEADQGVREGSAPLCTTCEKEEVVGEGGKGGESSTKSNSEKES